MSRTVTLAAALTAAVVGAALLSTPATAAGDAAGNAPATAAGNAPATAAGKPSEPRTVARGLNQPLHLEVTRKGVLVSQAGSATISRVKPDGTLTDVVVEEPSVEGAFPSVGGVASRGRTIAYLTTSGVPGPNPDGPLTVVAAHLKIREPDGDTRVLADLLEYEREQNPDARRTYGFVGLEESCAADVPAGQLAAEPYTGIVDSNPYEIARAPGGGWYVADAAGNSVLQVSPRGRIRTVYVAEPQPHVITAEAAASLGLPECTIGATYLFEPVPTDVEVTSSGHLLITQLPGGPESAVLGARGSLVKVAPWSGSRQTLARGLLAATNVAAGRHGKAYVTQLYGNQVSEVRWDRTLHKTRELPMPAAVEYFGGRLYVATNIFSSEQGSPDGRIVSFRAR